MSPRDLQTPKGNALNNAPHARAGTGDILAYRRRKGGWTFRDVAFADGKWTPEQVGIVEIQFRPSTADVARYVRALEALARP